MQAPKRLLLAKRVRCEMRVMNLVTRLSRENGSQVESRKSVSECLRCVKLSHIRALWEGATRELKGSSPSLAGLKEVFQTSTHLGILSRYYCG